MSDVALVALISSTGTVLVALASVAASIWGAAWREARQRKVELEEAAKTLRYTRAMELVSAIAARDVGAAAVKNAWAVTEARARFIATLRPGESAAEHFTRRMIDVVAEGHPSSYARRQDRPRMLEVHSDRLFAWLRGEITASELSAPEASWPVEARFEANSFVRLEASPTVANGTGDSDTENGS